MEKKRLLFFGKGTSDEILQQIKEEIKKQQEKKEGK